MNGFLQRSAAMSGFLLPAGFAATVQWNWHEWAIGWCSEWIDLGMAGLVLGPMQLMFEWSIL